MFNLDLTEGATTVISFYSASLSACVGPHFKSPSLEFLGKLWFEASSKCGSHLPRINAHLRQMNYDNQSELFSIRPSPTWQMKNLLQLRRSGSIMVNYMSNATMFCLLFILFSVPSLQPDAEKETENAALALFICGSIASEKFTLLSPR